MDNSLYSLSLIIICILALVNLYLDKVFDGWLRMGDAG